MKDKKPGDRRPRKPAATKLAAASALASGESVQRAADRAKVDRRTVQRWRSEDPEFAAMVRAAHAGHVEAWHEAGALALAEVLRRLTENAEAIDVRDLVGIATRAGLHIARLDEVVAGAPPGKSVAPLTPEERAERAALLGHDADPGD